MTVPRGSSSWGERCHSVTSRRDSGGAEGGGGGDLGMPGDERRAQSEERYCGIICGIIQNASFCAVFAPHLLQRNEYVKRNNAQEHVGNLGKCLEYFFLNRATCYLA